MNDAPPSPKASGPPPESTPTPRRLRRRLSVFVAVVVALLVVLRIALWLLLPWILDRVARGFELTVETEAIELDLLAGDLVVRELTASPLEGGEPLVVLEHLSLDVAVLRLFAGEVRIRRAEIDGAALRLERSADGSWEPLHRFAGEGAPDEEPDDEEPSEDAGPFDLSAPLRIDALRAQHVRTRVIDATVSPPVDAEVELTLHVSHVGDPQRDADLGLTIDAPGVLDALHVRGTLDTAPARLEASLSARMRGLDLRPLAAYLTPQGVEPRAASIDFTVDARIDARAMTGELDTLTTDVEVSGVDLSADGRGAAGLDRVTLHVERARGAPLTVSALRIEGPRARAARTEDGAIAAAGLLFRPVERPDEPDFAPAKPGGDDEITAASPPPKLGEIAVTGGAFEWSDRSVTPAVEIELGVEELTVDATRLGAGDEAAVVSAKLVAPGVFERLSLDGDVTPLAPRKSFHLSIEAVGVAPDALRGTLAAAGIESTLVDGALSLAVEGALEPRTDGTIGVTLALDDLVLRDGDQRLAALGHLGVQDLVVGPTRIAVADVSLGGVFLDAALEEEGSLRAFGFRFGLPARPSNAPAEPDRADEPPGPDPATSAPTPPPTIAVDRLRLSAEELTLRLAGRDGEELRLAETTFDVTNLRFGLPEGAPTELMLRIVAPEFAEELLVNGTASSTDDTFSVDLDVRGSGVTARAAAPFLAGVEPTLENGALAAHLAADVAFTPDGLSANARVSDVTFRDGATELLALEEARLVEAKVSPGRVDVREVRVAGLATEARRHEDGTISALGMHLVGGPPDRPTPPATGGTSSIGDPSPPPESSSVPSSAATVVHVREIRCERIEAAFDDAAVTPASRVTVRLDAVVDELALGPDGGVPSFQVDVRVLETDATISLSGDIALGPDRLEANVTLAGDHLEAGPLSAYLPAGMTTTFDDGRFRAQIEALDEAAPEGGRAVQVTIGAVDLRAREDAAPLLAWESLSLQAPRLDPVAEVFEIDTLVWSGLRAEARVTAAGAFEFAGLSLTPPTAAAATETESAVPASTESAVPTSTESAVPTSTESAVPTSTESAVPTSTESAPLEPDAPPTRRPLPRLSIGEVALGATRLSWVDERSAHPTPLVVEELSIRTSGGVTLDPTQPHDSPAVDLAIRVGIPPLVEALTVETTLSPFALEPALETTLLAEGIDGAAIESVFPTLAERLDASGIGRGTLTAHLATSLSGRRRGPLDFAFRDGFGVDLLIDGVSLRDETRDDEQAELFGVDELAVEVTRVAPNGDVDIRTVEVVRPRGDVTLTPEGIHVAGVTLLASPPPTEGEAVTAAGETAAASAGDAAPAPTGDAAGPTSETSPTTRLRELQMTGGAFRLEDRTVDPPLLLPLTDVEFNVWDFSTRTFVEEVPFRFALFLRATEVELPLEEKVSRPALGEAFVAGRLALHPAPTGLIKASLAALELSNFRGAAAGAGVTLTDGLLDVGTELRFVEDGSLDTTTRVTFTDLDLAEPPDGPISRLLLLPAPLNAVLFVLRDASGAIRIPLDFQLPADGVSLAGLATTGVSTLTRLIGTAVAQSPLRVGLSAGELIGLGGADDKGAIDEEPEFAPFLVGGAVVERSARARVDAIATRLRDDPTIGVVLTHELGLEDQELVRVRANPSREDALALAARLRDHKHAIVAARAERKTEARAAFATGRADAAETAREQLRALDRDLVVTEAALDRILSVVRRDAPRYAERRMRDACVALARLRLAQIRRRLVEAGVPDVDDRVRVRSPRYVAPALDGAGRVRIDTIAIVTSD